MYFLNALFNLGLLVAPVVVLFLFTLARFTVAALIERYRSHRRTRQILHNVMVRPTLYR